MSEPVGLPVGGSVTFEARCAVGGAASGSIANTATVAAGSGVSETNAGNNQATDTDPIGAAPLFADGFETGTTGRWSPARPAV